MARTSAQVQQVTCPACNGSGTKPVTVYNTSTGKPVTYSENCLSCMGTGTVTR